MSVDRDEVARIARLARLTFDEAGAERMAKDLSRILDHAERLREVAPEADVGDLAGVADAEAGASAGVAAAGEGDRGYGGVRDPALDSADLLAIPPGEFAPEWHDDFFVVPLPPGVAADQDEA